VEIPVFSVVQEFLVDSKQTLKNYDLKKAFLLISDFFSEIRASLQTVLRANTLSDNCPAIFKSFLWQSLQTHIIIFFFNIIPFYKTHCTVPGTW